MKSPLRLLKIVTLLTEVCAKAMLIVTLAANQTVQNARAKSDVCLVVIGRVSSAARRGVICREVSIDGARESGAYSPL